MRKRRTRAHAILWTCGAVLALGSGVCLAESNIFVGDRFAWASQAGWLNFRPDGAGAAVVFDGANGYLQGFVRSENAGWIKLGAGEGLGPYANADASNWGVNMDAAGDLSGFAWSAQAGWINFRPTHGGVHVDPETGTFSGMAWGENIGWICFSGESPSYSVRALIGDDLPDASAEDQWTLYE